MRNCRRLAGGGLYILFLIALSWQSSSATNDFCDGSNSEVDGKLLGAYTWLVPVPSKKDEVDLIYLSFCEPLNFTETDGPQQCNGATVCRVSTTRGNRTLQLRIPYDENNGPTIKNGYLFLNGGSCPTSAHKEVKYSISFHCGTHLGSPSFLIDVFCQAVLRWRTSAACHDKIRTKDVAKKQIVQIPCYVIDDKTGVKYDLSHLTKLSGHHKVDASKMDLYINICQEINDTMIHCGPGVAACINLQKSSWKSIGLISPQTRIELVKETGDLTLTYLAGRNSAPFQDCPQSPSTIIQFRCPRKRGLAKRPPLLMVKTSCNYVIEWETDHACPEHTILGDAQKCTITFDGKPIELGRLRNPKDTGYHRVQNVTIEGEQHEVIIDICNQGIGNGGACGSMGATQSANVCFKGSQKGEAVLLGSKGDAHLRYTDGRAILVYPDGAPCSKDSNRKWSSVIEFICDSESAFGEPVLGSVDSDLCVLNFEWRTVLVCVPEVIIQDEDSDYSDIQETCIHVGDNVTVDLTALYQATGPWFVRDDDRQLPQTLYLDICSPIHQVALTAGCPSDSSVCGVNKDQTSVSYGKHSTARLLDEKSSNRVSLLEFSEGSKCPNDGSKKYRTLVHLVCLPGGIGTHPQFIALDDENCELHLEWQTASACPRLALSNNTCILESPVDNFKIDLTPLRNLGPVTVENGNYTYEISVCAALPRNHKCGNEETSVCRRNKFDPKQVDALGAPSSEIIYNGGQTTVMYQNQNESSSITFTCDFNAQTGVPFVLGTQPGITVIEWTTAFACPTSNPHHQSCVVRSKDDSNHLYDLSRLNRVRPNQDWIVVGSDPHNTSISLKFFIALCGPLRKPPKGCNPMASVCVQTTYPNGSVTVADAGHAVDPPILNGGQLMLNYSNGDSCIRKGVNATRRTVVHFLCDEELEKAGESIQYIGNLDDCGHSLLWTTEAACPVRHQEVTDQCTVIDRMTGDVYNISHMRGENYYSSENYQFNLCGPIVNSKCRGDNVSVCYKDKNGKWNPVATSAGYKLDFVGIDTLKLTYLSDNSTSEVPTRVDIELVCSKSDEAKISEWPPLSDRVHRITVFSSGFCSQQRNDVTSCEFVNSETGHTYDLRTLVKKGTSNWEATQYSPVSQGYHFLTDPKAKYHFNVCRKLNRFASGTYDCPTDSFACETAKGSNGKTVSKSLGRHMENIVFGSDGTIVIKYVGGDPCPLNDTEIKNGVSVPKLRTSFVTIACSPSDQETPKIIKNEKSCEYIFYMETPAGCPVKRTMGSDCKVTDPNFNHVFDLTPLSDHDQVYTVANPDKKLTHQLSICKPLRNAKKLCGDENAGSCLIGKDGKNIALGKATSTLQYDTGILTLTYTNGVPGCSGTGANTTTTIHFLCDHSAVVGLTSPEFESMDENCGYVFNWFTELACPPIEEHECKVNTPEGLVDLSPLSMSRRNYIAHSSSDDDSTEKFVINVCRSVVHVKALSCDFYSGACSVAGNKTVNYGIASAPFYSVDQMSVQLAYSNGDACPNGEPGEKWNVLITFECQQEDTGPVHLVTQNCQAIFIWNTPHACPMAREVTPHKNHPCTAIHPASNQTIDLHSLVRADIESPYSVNGPHGSVFKLNICGKARGTSCGDDVGICLESRTEPAKLIGRTSQNLVWDDGVLAMTFTGEHECGLMKNSNRQNMSAIIHFVCPSAGLGRELPMFVSQSRDDCEYRFVWPTELACNHVLQCAHHEDGEVVDLSVLSSRPHKVHNLIDPGYQYFLSVCNPLEPKRLYASMPPNAAAVRVNIHTKQVESLGHAFLEPFTDFQGAFTLIYINGSKCEYDSNTLNKVRILFECDYSQDLGDPVLIDIDKDECVYLFRWRTSLVCMGASDTARIDPSKKCNFDIPARGLSLDLEPLSRKSPYQVKARSPDGKDAGVYSLSVCKDHPALSGCRNSELCYHHDHNVSYGIADSYFYQGRSLFVHYADGDTCPSAARKKFSAIVQFECDPLYESGGPVIVRQHACVTVFKWKTIHACSKQQIQEHVSHECVISQGSKTYDLSMLSSVSHVWKLHEPESKSTYYINICGSGFDWPIDAVDRCSQSGVCLERPVTSGAARDFSSLGSYVSRHMEVIAENHIRITYKGGDMQVCDDELNFPTTIIDFKCAVDGQSVGTPKLVQQPSSTNNCTYRFEWLTRSTCIENADEVVPHKNGLLIAPNKEQAVNLTALFNRTYRVSEHRNREDNYTYLINLRELCTETDCRVPWRMGPCLQSAVCQAKRGNFMKNLGSANKTKFRLQGRDLMLEVDSGTPCLDKADSTVKSIFSFACEPNIKRPQEPIFIYETRSCHYIFTWPTQYVCPEYMIQLSGPDNHNAEGGSSSATGTVYFLSILGVIAAGAMIFFSKPENRMAVRARTLRFFRTVSMPHYYYSKTESEMQSPLDNDGDTVLLSPSLVLQPDDDDFTPLA